VQGTLTQARSLIEKGGVEKAAKELEAKAAKLQKDQQQLDARRQKLATEEKQTQDKLDALSKAGKKDWDHEVQAFLDQKAKLDLEAKKLTVSSNKLVATAKALDNEKKTTESMKAKLEQAGVLKQGQSTDLNAAQAALTEKERLVYRSSIAGDRKTLRADSFIPATMAVIYLLLLIYFRSIGGYKPVHLTGTAATDTSVNAGMKPVA
jgi:hypothetical protein